MPIKNVFQGWEPKLKTAFLQSLSPSSLWVSVPARNIYLCQHRVHSRLQCKYLLCYAISMGCWGKSFPPFFSGLGAHSVIFPFSSLLIACSAFCSYLKVFSWRSQCGPSQSWLGAAQGSPDSTSIEAGLQCGASCQDLGTSPTVHHHRILRVSSPLFTPHKTVTSIQACNPTWIIWIEILATSTSQNTQVIGGLRYFHGLMELICSLRSRRDRIWNCSICSANKLSH